MTLSCLLTLPSTEKRRTSAGTWKHLTSKASFTRPQQLYKMMSSSLTRPNAAVVKTNSFSPVYAAFTESMQACFSLRFFVKFLGTTGLKR